MYNICKNVNLMNYKKKMHTYKNVNLINKMNNLYICKLSNPTLIVTKLKTYGQSVEPARNINILLHIYIYIYVHTYRTGNKNQTVIHNISVLTKKLQITF